MYTLLEFVHKYLYVFLFLALEAVSFFLLFRFNNYQGSVWLSAANSTVAGIDRLYGDAVAYLNLGEANRRLTDENVRLQLETDRLREALLTATRDTLYTERTVLKRLADYRLIPATVVSSTQERGGHYLVIDRGTEDGVRAEMGVVGGGGVVGIVYLTGPHYSLVIPVVNKKSSVSCRVRGSRNFGYLQWSGGSRLHATVVDIPRYARISRGEVVETSGYSAVFPPGIFVGRVTGVSNSADGQSHNLDVTLGTDFSTLRDVNVIATSYKPELDTLRVNAARTDALLEN